LSIGSGVIVFEDSGDGAVAAVQGGGDIHVAEAAAPADADGFGEFVAV
jgi:hypothetical protein